MIDQTNPQPEAKPACKDCGSPAVVKFGTYKGVQRYYCKSCKRKFKADDSLFHMKVSASHISSALSMYYRGMSINDIRLNMKQEHEYYPSKAVVYYWVDKYTDNAIKHFRNVHPVKIGDNWIADETVLDVDGRHVWMWDIIDADSRFLLASRVSYNRGAHDAQMLMEEARRKAGKSPKTVTTDKLGSYNDGIELTFGSETDHKQSKPFTNAEDSTNKIERWHSTLKERTKVMRGLKDIGSAIQFTDGFVVYYNFFRPHEGLDGRTPAEAAGINYTVKNWADLSRLPVTKQAELKTHDQTMLLTTKEPNLEPKIPKNIKDLLGMGNNRILGSNGMPKLSRNRRQWR
jgi:putative transposase